MFYLFCVFYGYCRIGVNEVPNSNRFACKLCDTIDLYSMVDNTENLCSECDTGQWHGFFTKETFDPDKHEVNNRQSNSDSYDSPSFG